MSIITQAVTWFSNSQVTEKIEVGVCASLCTTLIVAATRFGGDRWLKNRVSVRRLHWGDDRDTDGMLELYSMLFPPDGKNYTAEEIKGFLGLKDAPAGPTHVEVENVFLIAKSQGKVIAFLWSCYYPEDRMAIIPYYGIDKRVEEARSTGVAKRLLKKLRQILEHHTPSCQRLVFEAAKPRTAISARDKGRRIARIIRFKTVGRQLKRPVYEVQFNYLRPRLSLEDAESSEEELCLMFCDLGKQKDELGFLSALKREEFAAILKFLHLSCYADVYPVDDPRHSEFYSYLTSRLEQTLLTIPEEVLLSRK